MTGQIRFAKPGLGIVILASSMLSLFTWIGEVRAIPLCENRTGNCTSCGSPLSARVCREDLEQRVNTALASLQNGLDDPDDARNAIQDYEAALESFADARVDRDDTTTSLQTRCNNASAEDERAIKNAARGVRDSFELTADQFISNAAFNAARTAMTNLTRDMINAVSNNLDELSTLIPPTTNDIVTARQRVQKARSNFAAGKLVTAADSTQSAYDIVEDNGNSTMGCLNFQFP